MKIVDWVEWDDSPEFELTDDEYKEAYPIVVEEVRKNGYHFDGSYHQNGEYGCPKFDNGKIFMVSCRTWGGIIADAFPDEFDDPDDPMNYVVWYLGPMTKGKDGRPEYDSSKVKLPK